MFYPGLTGLKCDDCCSWIHTFSPPNSQAKLISFTRKTVPLRDGTDGTKSFPMPKGAKPPCWRCPKKNPTEGKRLEKSLPRAIKAIEIFYEIQGTSGRSLGDNPDPIVMRNMGIVQEILDEAKSYHLTMGLGTALLSKGQ